jgi:hypothetical protein
MGLYSKICRFCAKIQLQQSLKQTSILHTPPNFPSQPPFLKALYFPLQTVGPTISFPPLPATHRFSSPRTNRGQRRCPLGVAAVLPSLSAPPFALPSARHPLLCLAHVPSVDALGSSRRCWPAVLPLLPERVASSSSSSFSRGVPDAPRAPRGIASERAGG